MTEVIGAVLAAGKGTRLRPLTHHLPKPIVPLAGRPMLSYALDALKAAGVTRVGINAYHLAEAVPAGLAHRPEDIEYVFEETLSGTGGGILGIARRLPKATMVVINGDAVFGFDLAPFITRHRERGALATLILREVPPDAPFGRVGIDPRGRLHRIAEVDGPDADNHVLRYGAFTGVQIIEPGLIDAIPDGPCDILRSAYRHFLDERAPLYGDFAPADAAWHDVGTPERYLEAHFAVLRGDLPSAHLPPRDGSRRHVSPSSIVGAGAEIHGPCAIMDGARIGSGAKVGPYTFIDRGAVVAPNAVISKAVVWPDARVEADVEGDIVLPDEASTGD